MSKQMNDIQKLMQSASAFNYLFKFIVIGDTGVGKSCVVMQFVQQKLRLEHEVTIGVEFAAKNLTINKKVVKLQIWDTAGQENFRSITRSYYRSAIGALLVYDITRRESFEHLQEWIQEVKANGSAFVQVLLVGNKSDLQSQRKVSTDEGKAFAKQQGIKFVETSAKEYKKVETAFNLLAEDIVRQIENGHIPEQTIGIKVSDDFKFETATAKRKLCC